MTRRAFVVAHYDPAGRVARYLRNLVSHLNRRKTVPADLAPPAEVGIAGGSCPSPISPRTGR